VGRDGKARRVTGHGESRGELRELQAHHERPGAAQLGADLSAKVRALSVTAVTVASSVAPNATDKRRALV